MEARFEAAVNEGDVYSVHQMALALIRWQSRRGEMAEAFKTVEKSSSLLVMKDPSCFHSVIQSLAMLLQKYRPNKSKELVDSILSLWESWCQLEAYNTMQMYFIGVLLRWHGERKVFLQKLVALLAHAKPKYSRLDYPLVLRMVDILLTCVDYEPVAKNLTVRLVDSIFENQGDSATYSRLFPLTIIQVLMLKNFKIAKLMLDDFASLVVSKSRTLSILPADFAIDTTICNSADDVKIIDIFGDAPTVILDTADSYKLAAILYCCARFQVGSSLFEETLSAFPCILNPPRIIGHADYVAADINGFRELFILAHS